MKILSMGYVWPAFVAGKKSVTRREWDDDYARRWQAGEEVQVYDRSPRFAGKLIGIARIVSVAKESLATMPDSDYAAEGFAYLQEIGHTPPRASGFADFSRGTFEGWRATGKEVWVIRFDIVRVEAEAPAPPAPPRDLFSRARAKRSK